MAAAGVAEAPTEPGKLLSYWGTNYQGEVGDLAPQ